MRLPDPPLLLVTDRRLARRPLAAIVAAALDAGCRWVSLREKDLPDDEQIVLARRLLPMTRAAGSRLLLHGEASLAEHAGTDGVHLPSGADAAAARALLGRQRLIGVSIHTVTEAEAIDPHCVDYALAGPAFETPSKPGYGPEIGRKGISTSHARRGCLSLPSAASMRRVLPTSSPQAQRGRRDGRHHARGRSGAGGSGLIAALKGALAISAPGRC